MKTILLTLLFTLSLFGSAFSQPNKPVKFIKDQYIVVLKDGVDSAATAKTHKGQIKKFFKKAFNGYFVYMDAAEAEKLRKNPNVKSVEQNRVMEPAEATSLWNLDRVDQRAYPLDGQYNSPYNGQGVTAYIIDSGINFSHEEFEGRASVGQDYVGDGLNGADCLGHGTHVAGIIGGKTYGIAKKVNLVSMRVGACNGYAEIWTMLSAIDWVMTNGQRPAVINISYTAAGVSSSVDTVIANAFNSGIIVVTAAGNSHWDACEFTPAGSPKSLTVGATGSDDLAWLGSNYGSCVELYAPGIAITSAWVGSTTAAYTQGGTSMASPHVAGAIALYLQQRPLDGATATQNFILNQATPNVVSDTRGGANRFLFSGFTVPPQVIPTCNQSNSKGYLQAGQTLYLPSASGATGKGLFTATLTLGDGVVGNIALQKKQGNSWSTVASGSQIYSQQAKATTFRYAVSAPTSANYVLCYNFPL